MMQTLNMLICVRHVILLGNFRGAQRFLRKLVPIGIGKGCILSLFFEKEEGSKGNVVPLNKIELKINYICIDINSQYVRFKLF